MNQGVIIQGRGGLYTVLDEQGRQFVLRAKKKFRKQKLTPLVGDQILFTPGEISDEHGWIEEILPRKSVCLRPPVANATLLCIVAAPRPEPDWLLIDKLLIFARKNRLRPLLIINKTDLEPENETALRAAQMYAGAEMETLDVCARTGAGLDALRARLAGETCCFSGQSGVGKSTLLNALFGLNLETGDISRKIQRGKNTTRHAELFRLDDTQLIDTPGFSLLEMDDVFDPVLLQDYYPEFAPYQGQCRFQPCYHGSEPGCAVTAARDAGKIHPERLARYQILLADCRQAWRERYD